MSVEMNQLYRFGEFTVDGEQRVLLRDNSPVSVAPKVFDTLVILVENRGRIVEKDELMRKLWPDTFVEESNLAFNIQQLRKSLGDNARQPKFVETVARRGYRFIAEVTEGKPSDGGSAVVVSKGRRPYSYVALISVLIVGLIVVGLWLTRSQRSRGASRAPILSSALKSEKFFSGGSIQAVITPDGKYVAYTSESGDKESIWLRKLETSENIQVVSPTNSRYFGLAVSPDGNALYFARHTKGDPYRMIYRVMTFGGIPTKILDNTEGCFSVSPDGKQLSFVRCKYADEDYCSLYVADVDGKNERRLTSRQKPMRISDNQFSPDGKSIAFAVGQSATGGNDFRLMQIDLQSRSETQASAKTFFDITDVTWLPGGEGLLLTAKEALDGKLRIWHVSIPGDGAHPITNDATEYKGLSLSMAGDKMVATSMSNTFRLYFAKLDDVNHPKNLAPARSGVTFTSDGKLVYAGNDADIWTINRDGGEQRQLSNNPFTDISPRLSGDNRYIFFASNRTGSTQVWRMNTDGSNQVQLTKREGGYPRFVSHDGKWVYFISGLNDNLWRVPSEGGDETQIPLPVSSFSPDGKFVAYFLIDRERQTQPKLVIASVDEGRILRTFKAGDDKSKPIGIDLISGWVRDNKSFYYVTTDGSHNYVWRQLLEAENPELIGDLGGEQIAHFAISPDGQGVAYIRGKWIFDALVIEGLR